jgi:hypothetical protein
MPYMKQMLAYSTLINRAILVHCYCYFDDCLFTFSVPDYLLNKVLSLATGFYITLYILSTAKEREV